MLFDVSAFCAPLPTGVQVFASGANRVAEIRGFAKLGIPIGVAVNHLGESAITELIELQRPVMIDSGAFSEVVFTAEGARIVSPITDDEWRRRLALYLRIASSLREKAMLVAPDQVGNQQATLRRLTRYRAELAEISETGAILLLPLQVGESSHADFFEAAKLAAGTSLTPAMPMRKAVTTAEALLKFVREVKPPHVHLLGIGIENRRADVLIRTIQHFSPDTTISMDSNRLRAKAGVARPLTTTEAELRLAETERVYGAVESPVLVLTGDGLDYTELIAYPSLWCPHQQLRDVADAVGLSATDTEVLVSDPDGFLQSALTDSWDLMWIEHPVMSLELDRMWERFVDETVRSGVRTAAIVSVFGDSRISATANKAA
jgi:hypothetical protein